MIDLLYTRQDSIRVKITDRCPWNCWWCHNEGTGKRNPSRVGDIIWDEEFRSIISTLKADLDIDTVHLTGGEPSTHPELIELVKGLTSLGVKVKMTTMGFPPRILSSLLQAGLRYFNFSVHALDVSLMSKTQNDRSFDWVKKHLTQQLSCLLIAKESGAFVKINSVMANDEDRSRITSVMNWAHSNNISFRVMNELSSGYTSTKAIQQLLGDLGAVETKRKLIVGSSSFTSTYTLPDGKTIQFKQIRPLHLESMCTLCPLPKTRCHEKFYGIRLERQRVESDWVFYVRLCLHRSSTDTLLPYNLFTTSSQYGELRSLLAKPKDSVTLA